MYWHAPKEERVLFHWRVLKPPNSEYKQYVALIHVFFFHHSPVFPDVYSGSLFIVKFEYIKKLPKPNCSQFYFVGAADAGSNDMKYPVQLLKSVQKMAEDFHSLLTDKEKKKLAGFMRKLGFDDIAATLYDLPEESERKVRIVR